MTMGVYCIQVEKEHYWQSYVGISKNIEQRWRQHKSDLSYNRHKNKYLQNSWNQYEKNSFEFHILEEVDNYNKLHALEKEYTYAFGYGDYSLCFNVGSPGETNGFVGKHHTEDAKEKMRQARKGKKHTEEAKQKMSEALQGEKHPMFGKHHTKETKQKISQSSKGKKHTEETKQKMSESRKGERSHNVKLTELQARFILTVKTTQKNRNVSDFMQQELAYYFKVSVYCVRQVMLRKTWKHIEPMSIEEYEKFKKNL